MTSARRAAQVAVAALLAAGVAACGLKGALSLPEKSGNVVIRGQASGSTTEATPTATAAPAPGETPATPPAEPKLPPPDLPHSNSGSPR